MILGETGDSVEYFVSKEKTGNEKMQTDYAKMASGENKNPVTQGPNKPPRRLYGSTYDGINYPIFLPCEPKEHLRNIRNLECPEDDTIVCSYPKSGTHWVLEIVSMLKRRRATHTAALHFLDIIPTKAMEGIPSPRVFATHLRFKQLPEQFRRNRSKVIYVLRNPKDVAVSLYQFSKKNRDISYDGSWDEFFQSFLDGEVGYSSWFNHVRSWEESRDNDQKYPMLFVFYEDLQKNPEKEIRRIADFLGVWCDESLLDSILEKTSLNKMRSHSYQYYLVPPEYMDPNHQTNLFNKGSVGGWKQYFSLKQHQAFDRLYSDNMKDSTLDFKFQLLSSV